MLDAKSSAAKFLQDHDALQDNYDTALLTITDLQREIDKQDAKISVQGDMLAQATHDKNMYLRYSVELAAQLQFIIAGSSRALLIAGQVRNAIALDAAATIPPVPGADIAELEDVLRRIGEHNADAADGNGMTNTAPPRTPGSSTITAGPAKPGKGEDGWAGPDWRNANGAADAPKPLTAEQIAKMDQADKAAQPVNVRDLPVVTGEQFAATYGVHPDYAPPAAPDAVISADALPPIGMIQQMSPGVFVNHVGVRVNRDGEPIVAEMTIHPDQTVSIIKIDPPAVSMTNPDCVMVDINGQPITPSLASQSLKMAS